jgi:hypothetical protein
VAPPPAVGAKLGLTTYASACAWATVYPERAEEGWAKYGLVGPAIEREHEAWRVHFDRHPEERGEFERHVQSFHSHWATLRC